DADTEPPHLVAAGAADDGAEQVGRRADVPPDDARLAAQVPAGARAEVGAEPGAGLGAVHRTARHGDAGGARVTGDADAEPGSMNRPVLEAELEVEAAGGVLAGELHDVVAAVVGHDRPEAPAEAELELDLLLRERRRALAAAGHEHGAGSGRQVVAELAVGLLRLALVLEALVDAPLPLR